MLRKGDGGGNGATVGCNLGDAGTADVHVGLRGDLEEDLLGVIPPILEDGVGINIMGVSGNKSLIVEEAVEFTD